jgi:DNA-binding SARP family transcriptional activator
MSKSQPHIEIRLLGPLQISVDGRPVSVSGAKRALLLTLLGLRDGRSVAVDALMEELWGPDVPSTERNAVQHHVTRLRGLLGRDSIVPTQGGYALVGATTDATEFEALVSDARAALREGDPARAAGLAERALGLWRGAALQGLDSPSLTAEAARLEALRVDALEEHFEAALALGRHREIVSELQHAIDENPFRERLWRQLMLALYRSGRQVDALETYQMARRMLLDQLGLEPSPSLREVQEAILAHDPAIAEVVVARVDGRRQELGRLVEQLRRDLRHAEALFAAAHGALDAPVLVAVPA